MIVHECQREGEVKADAWVSELRAARGRWDRPQAREHQKGIGLVGEMMSSVLLGLGSLGER